MELFCINYQFLYLKNNNANIQNDLKWNVKNLKYSICTFTDSWTTQTTVMNVFNSLPQNTLYHITSWGFWDNHDRLKKITSFFFEIYELFGLVDLYIENSNDALKIIMSYLVQSVEWVSN